MMLFIRIATMSPKATSLEDGGAGTPTFVWWSTQDSVRNGTPSALACFEVFAAVSGYWFIAIYFETFTHLWVSICVAPLLLLRSDQSISLGVKWFQSYMTSSHELAHAPSSTVAKLPGYWFAFLISLIISIALLFALSNY